MVPKNQNQTGGNQSKSTGTLTLAALQMPAAGTGKKKTEKQVFYLPSTTSGSSNTLTFKTRIAKIRKYVLMLKRETLDKSKPTFELSSLFGRFGSSPVVCKWAKLIFCFLLTYVT